MIQKSLSLTLNRRMMFKAGEGAGSSGCFFFFSHDQRFLIKTMSSEEVKKMLKMLDAYIEHIKATKNESLLARIYGIFKISTNYFAPVNIMIMQNTCYQMRRRTQKKLTFDIKGSTIDRHVKCLYRRSKNKELTCYQRGKDYCSKVLKDINFCELNNDSKRPVVRIPSKNAKHVR